MWARASALHRHLECPAASWYPRDEHGKWVPGYLANPDTVILPIGENEESSIFAEWGTKMHLAKENAPSAEEPWLSKWIDQRDKLYPPLLGSHEKTYSYDCRTGQVLKFRGLNKDSDEWKLQRGPDCVTGTCDWVGNLPTGDIWVDDLKTGHQAPDPLMIQLQFYGFCEAKHSWVGLIPKTKQIRTSATHWRRDWDEPVRYWGSITWAQLELFEAEMQRAWREALRLPKPIPGTHCQYCPSFKLCEAINGK
jgi:hypothetical protein